MPQKKEKGKKGRTRAKPAPKKLHKLTPKKVYKLSPKTRKRMSQAHLGKKLSEETKQKIRDAKAEQKVLVEMGLKEPFRHSEETKQKLSRLMKRRKIHPTKKAIRKSAEERRNRATDKKIAKKVQKGLL